MLRLYFLQQWFGLADEALEDAVYDSQAFRGFLGLDLGREAVPDATTLLKFRHLLEKSGLRVVEMRPMGGYFWFLSFNLQHLHVILFPKPKNKWLRILQLPFELTVQLIFFIIIPLIFYYLDALDKTKDYTLGWSCIAEKPLPDESTPTLTE